MRSSPDGSPSFENVGVVILAGGLGTRLATLPGDVPKPLRTVAGRPFLEHQLLALRRQGARAVVLALAHRPRAFEEWLATGDLSGLEVRTSIELEPLGTGGAIRLALQRVAEPRILVMNGDSHAHTSVAVFLDRHVQSRAAISILAARVDDASRYGSLEVDADLRVTRFEEKGRFRPGLVNAGVYVFERPAALEIPAGRPVSLEREVLPAWIGRGLHAVAGHFPFLDIGTPEDYARADRFFSEISSADPS